MNRFFTLLFAASCLTAVGQGDDADNFCCDFDSQNYIGGQTCFLAGLTGNYNDQTGDGFVGDCDCADVDPSIDCVPNSGCTDINACNYNPNATTDDGSCQFLDDCGQCGGQSFGGCADELACNYTPEACAFLECVYYDAIGVCGGGCFADENGDGICDEVADPDSCILDDDNDGIVNCEDACPNGLFDLDGDSICDDVDNCIDTVACNFNDPANGECLYSEECGVCDGEGIPAGDCDCDGNQLDAIDVCGGSCLEDDDDNGVCDDQEVYGCSYPLAENFSSSVTRDDGSCIFPCEGVVNTNVFDWDGDYVVTVTDFLMMLSVYGDTDVDLDGVWDSGDDCVDTNACNYANDPSEPCTYIDVLGVCGGGCEADEDNDGICDDIDTCIGIEDECGVCNGPGPTEVVIEDITILYDSVYLPQLEEWYVYEFGADTTFSYTCAPSFSSCGDPVSYQGYDYATVLIGEQCWFAENLRSEHYENGDAIPANLSDSEWQTTNSGAVAVYGEDDGCNHYSPDIDACDPSQSLSEYGRLYNWYAVYDARGLCPSGWHVPTDGEWTVMTNVLGGESVAGGQMKSTYGWYGGGNGTNSSGFSGLPGGGRNSNDGNFSSAGLNGGWWSSSPDGSSAWSRNLYYSIEGVYRNGYNRRYGFSVRCVRDAE